MPSQDHNPEPLDPVPLALAIWLGLVATIGGLDRMPLATGHGPGVAPLAHEAPVADLIFAGG